MKSPALCLFLVFAASILFVYFTSAAIIHRTPHLIGHQPIESLANNTFEYTRQTTLTVNENHPNLFTRKFILLTTGDHIKLYPFVYNQNKTNDNSKFSFVNFTLSQTHYLIKPKELETKGLNPFSPFTKWLQKRSDKRKNLNHTDVKASILPSEETGTDEDEYGDETDYKKPRITQVDYFLNRDFCLNNKELRDEDCLVIVWLDRSNDLVRFGSMNLIESPIEYVSSVKSNLTTTKTNVLWLDEFTPIDINEFKACNQEDCSNYVLSMVVDKRRHILHLATSLFCGNGYAIRSEKFDPIRPPQDSNRERQLGDKQLRQFNSCPQGVGPTELDESTFDNLNIDEVNGDWLFYLDKTEGGKIFALNTYNKWSSVYPNSCHPQTLQVLVKDIPKWIKQINDEELETIAMTIDPERRLLYWLTKDNRLYGSDYSGQGLRRIGTLPTKPSLRAPYSLQVIRNTLFISDSTKKSLVAYKFENIEAGWQWPCCWESERNFTILPYEVLLVEMPTLYGFRIVDLDNLSTTPSIYNEYSRQRSREKADEVIQMLIDEQSFLTYFRALFNGLFQYSGYDIYALMDLHPQNDLYCGYLQKDVDKSSISQFLRGTAGFFYLCWYFILFVCVCYWSYRCYRCISTNRLCTDKKIATKDIQSNV